MENKTTKNDIRVFVNKNVYLMHEDKLQECKLLRTRFIADQDDMYLVSTTVQLPDGRTIQDVCYDMVYDTPEDYERKKYAQTCSTKVCGSISSVYGCLVGRRMETYKNNVFYTFANGQVYQNEADLDNFVYDYILSKWVSYEVLQDEPIYSSHGQACSYNTINVVDENGRQSQRIGINALLALDPDQKALVKELEDVIAKLRKSNVVLLADTCEQFYAYNGRNIADYNLNYEDYADVDEEERDNYEKADRYGEPFRVNINYEMWSEDYALFVKRKK
jgi:hypothetical protein